jgi:hypothetical protein
VHIAAIVATVALVSGFASALLVYGPLGTPHRQLSGSDLGAPPVGVTFGSGQEILATQLDLTNATMDNPEWNWTDASGFFTGPCNASGVLNASSGGIYDPYDDASSSVNVTGGNVTLVCLNSVGVTPDFPYGGGVSATWYFNSLGSPWTINNYSATNFMANGSYFNNNLVNVSSCNSWTLGPNGQSPWNLTHIDNANFTPCPTYYEMNNNTTYLPSFYGEYLGLFPSGPYEGFPEYANSTLWAPDEIGYGPSDLVYELPVTFSNSTSTDGLYQVSIAIAGVTPTVQTFFLLNQVHGSDLGPGTVLFVFDLTAAWLYDPVYNMTGQVAPSTAPEIYGAVGTASALVTECTSDYACPAPSSAEVGE